MNASTGTVKVECGKFRVEASDGTNIETNGKIGVYVKVMCNFHCVFLRFHLIFNTKNSYFIHPNAGYIFRSSSKPSCCPRSIEPSIPPRNRAVPDKEPRVCPRAPHAR